MNAWDFVTRSHDALSRGSKLLLAAFAAGGDEALAEARLEMYLHLDSGPPPSAAESGGIR
jgi:hypothetical protein